MARMRPRLALAATLALAWTVWALAGPGAALAEPTADAAPAHPVHAVHAVHAATTAHAAQADPGDDPDGDPSTDDSVVPDQNIIPRPNSGREPGEAGDRGGALQIAVFLAIVGGVGLIAALVVRESRRSRQA